jgi:multidrug resistance efflux pump
MVGNRTFFIDVKIRQARYFVKYGGGRDDMEICSPKDGFVVSLLVKDGQPVKSGELLLQLDSAQEDRHLERVQTAESVRAIRAAQYTGPQLEVLRSIAQAAIDIATAKAKASLVRYEYAARNTQIGINTTADSREKEAEHLLAQAELARAQAQQKQLEFAVQRHVETDALARRFSENEKAFFTKRRELLAINAPRDGRVKLRVAQGSFAELGSVLAEVN